jgi:hypothetical protein
LTMRNLRTCPTQITTVFRGNMKVNHGKPSIFGDNIKQSRFCQHVQDLEVICSIYRSLYSNFGKWSLKDRWMLGKDRSHLKQAVKWKMTWGQVLFLKYSWTFHLNESWVIPDYTYNKWTKNKLSQWYINTYFKMPKSNSLFVKTQWHRQH